MFLLIHKHPPNEFSTGGHTCSHHLDSCIQAFLLLCRPAKKNWRAYQHKTGGVITTRYQHCLEQKFSKHFSNRKIVFHMIAQSNVIVNCGATPLINYCKGTLQYGSTLWTYYRSYCNSTSSALHTCNIDGLSSREERELHKTAALEIQCNTEDIWMLLYFILTLQNSMLLFHLQHE